MTGGDGVVLRVAGALIEADAPRDDAGWCLPGREWAPGRALIARRGPDKRHAGKWELPGGKLEPGESAAQCLERELVEELGIAVSVGAWIATNEHDYGGGPLALEAWRCRWESGRLTPVDHDAFAWVAPAEMLAFDLAEADIPLVHALLAQLHLVNHVRLVGLS